MVDVQTTQATAMSEAVDANRQRMAELKVQTERGLVKLDENYQSLKEQVKSRYEKKWAAMAGRWREGMERVTAELAAVRQAVDAVGPPWDDPSWADRPLPRSLPPVLRLGEAAVDLASLPGGVSSDPRLMEGIRRRFDLAVMRAFPGAANLLIETPPEGRAAAVAVLQASMFRILTSLPPGMVRFTIVDPIGIGRNFGAFMHLADFDPALVNGQVWTDPRQIDERLAELEAHMETVTQKYLRNEYPTIEAYNAVAEEVAEPYRVLVIADFPVKFDEKAAGRLASIAAGGVPCGVLVLAAVDTSRTMPPGFGLNDLRPHCAHLDWKEGDLAWDDPDLIPFPLALDPPPPSEFATRQIQKVGAAARAAKRVEVPFDFIAPPREAWWTQDSRSGIDIALGKAGATKRQNLTLGQGTSQHVLIAGRTGSGKSTLMHALITNLALYYSPDEIDLYLIDFKKGVEFKIYATFGLPHASVVAIESEREFGISVLQRLDLEMKMRADRFRDAGVQDVSGYRNAPGRLPCPGSCSSWTSSRSSSSRRTSSRRRPRSCSTAWCARAGPSACTYTWDRSRWAERSRSPAARLGRWPCASPCNAARWIRCSSWPRTTWRRSGSRGRARPSTTMPTERRRGTTFSRLSGFPTSARKSISGSSAPWAANVPRAGTHADRLRGGRRRRPGANPLLGQQLDLPAWPETPKSALAWVGDPVAIKEPTSALFRRQGGSHLLIVGQNGEAAVGVTAAALLSLAAQFPPARSDGTRYGARFFVLDGTPEDDEQAGALARIASALPHEVKVGGWRDAAPFLAAVAGEVALRQQPDSGDGPEIFLLIHDLSRFRDLRRREDDFGFGRKEDELTPPDHLDIILREGPGFGVHLLAWCDTVNNLNRYATHQQLREFAMRVLFQMSPTDSGGLLDSPAASKLGPNRALFASEEQNRLEEVPALRPAAGGVGQEHGRPAPEAHAAVSLDAAC